MLAPSLHTQHTHTHTHTHAHTHHNHPTHNFVRHSDEQVPGNIFDDSIRRNELVVRIQPNEAIWLNVINKKPGMKFETAETFLDMSCVNLPPLNTLYE